MVEHKADVFISGAGPVGLLIAYQLNRLGVSTYIIDAADKTSPNFPMYGRASTLFPRTLEMLDQLDLYDEMAQEGLIAKRNACFKDGEAVQGRGWVGMESLHDTYFAFVLNLRLKYSEDIFRKRIEKLGTKVQAPVKLIDLSLDENADDDHKVTATCATPDGKSFKVRSRYIVGSDGGSSAVRKLGGIPFIGEDKEDRWVRIDGHVKTNYPEARCGLGAFESKTHGHVLWVSLDHGATRIGYVLSPEMYAHYGRDMSQEDAIKEARAAVAPFELEFTHVDWHTVYVVKQHVAERLQDRERILLAGDAAHVHSSGTAQGMNTGTHDAMSLAWRLGGVINGLYKAEVLANYSEERKAIAEHLIENDRVVSALISGRKPEKFKHRSEDTVVLFDEHQRREHGFMMGTGIKYPPNLLNDVQGSFPPLGAVPGHRAPDVLLHKPGFKNMPIRLFEVTKWNGTFHILVFTGDARDTRNSLRKLRGQVDDLAPRLQHAVSFHTIVLGHGIAFDEHLDTRKFGDAYWDIDHSAHVRYHITLDRGAIAVVRPDGILGFAAPLDGFDRVAEYLNRLIIPRDQEPAAVNGANGHIGEMINLDENNLYYKHVQEQDIPQSKEQGTVVGR